jgi:hypothetical protein
MYDMDFPSGEGRPSLVAEVPDQICRMLGPRSTPPATGRVLAMSESFCLAVRTSSVRSG